MLSKKDTAIKLRLEGKSYSEIKSELHIAKSTLSSWLKDVPLSNEAKTRLESRMRQGVENGFIKRNKLQTLWARDRAKSIQESASLEISTLSAHELKLIGIALYWAEGYKRARVSGGIERTAHTISFVNADPEMIRLFIKFLLETMQIPVSSIRLYMRLFPDSDEAAALDYWKDITGMDDSHFHKTTFLKSSASKGIRPANRLPHGTLQIEVCSTAEFHRLLGWIHGMKMAM